MRAALSRVSEPEIREVHDRAVWNSLVLSFPHYDFRQSFEWGEVRRSAGWEPFRYAVFEGGKSIACVSILAQRIPGTGFSLLYAPRGPLMDFQDQVAWRGIRAAVDDAARRTGAILLRASPPVLEKDEQSKAAFQQQGYLPLDLKWSTWNTPRVTMLLDLSGSEEEVLGRMVSDYRRRLRRALRDGISVRMETSPAAMAQFRKGLARFAARKGFPVRDELYFQRFREEFGQSTSWLCFYEKDGRPLAADFTVRFGRRAYALWYYAEDNHPNIGRLSDWNLIRSARETGCDTVDYGSPGTDIPPSPQDPGYGIYTYKKEMGCVLEQFASYQDLVFKPRPYHIFRFLEDRILPRFWTIRARFNR